MRDIVTFIKLAVAMAGISDVCPLANAIATFTTTSIIVEAVPSHVVTTVIAGSVTLASTVAV